MIRALLLLTAALYPVWEAAKVRLVRLRIDLESLPLELDGLTLLLLTDLHVSRIGRRERNLHRLLERLPVVDLFLLGGDTARDEKGMRAALQVVSPVTPKHGAFAVLGNSEHKRGVPTDRLVRMLEDAGFCVLVNTSRVLTVRSVPLAVVGVDDPYEQLDDPKGALSSVPEDALTILLAHSPEVIAHVPAPGPELILAGHTHGGQMRLPWMPAIYTHNVRGIDLDCGLFPPDVLNRYRRSAGLRSLMYVSRGVGASLLPARLLCPPEAVLIALHRRRPVSAAPHQ
ncbi:MAG: metallophosphoesterase [Armatimonadota bacterium]